MRRYVLGFYLTPNGVILIEKTRPEWQRGKWNGLGGSIEPGESAVDAMVREFAEEACIHTEPSDWQVLFVLSGGTVGGVVKPWQMTVLTMFASVQRALHLPWHSSEGVVDFKDHVPNNVDSTAAWLIQMCWDMHKHGIALSPPASGVITDFCSRVKVRAESNIEANGTVSGAHWNAMRQVCKEMGVEVDL